MTKARLKTQAELEQERMEAARYALCNVVLNLEKLLLIYARQSSSKQYVSNIYSAIEQRDGLLERAYELGWTRDEQWILYVENQLAKKTHVSGSLRIDQRPGLQALTEVIIKGLASAVLVVSVDRITRDPDMITPVQFANICKEHGVLIITDDYIYDFNNPNRDDMGRFLNEAIAAKEFVRKQIKGKALRGRTRKANMGLVASGQTPIGLMLDGSALDKKGKPYKLVPSPHAERVDWLYGRFRALDANLAALFREVVKMTLRGEALFLDDDRIDPKSIHLDRTPNNNGWTIRSKAGLRYILSNPAYIGHLVFNGRIVKKNAHPAIVDADNWQYAFDHLADVDLDGQPIERPERTVRYTQEASVDSGALLTGTRDTGTATIGSINGASVYYNNAIRSYIIYQRLKSGVYYTETKVQSQILDTIVEERLLHWLKILDRSGADWITMDESVAYQTEPYTYLVTKPVKGSQTPSTAMDTVERIQSPQPKSTVEGDLELTIQDLAKVERRLRTSEDVMSDEDLRETYDKKARLLKRRAELERIIDQRARLAKKQEQAKEDIEVAHQKWHKWTLEKKRSFIGMVTESITLEKIANGWLRLTIVWSPVMGFIKSVDTSVRAVDVAYIWRRAGDAWSEEEEEIIRTHYPTATRYELLHLLPDRTWTSIMTKARLMEIARPHPKHENLNIPEDMSATDTQILSEFMLEPGKRVQWEHYHTYQQMTNEDIPS
jgi:Resolvase, N terminal domain/Recombinase